MRLGSTVKAHGASREMRSFASNISLLKLEIRTRTSSSMSGARRTTSKLRIGIERT
jgi:hypothetical protein